MKAQMSLRLPALALLSVMLLPGCMSGAQTRAERLAMLQAHAGAPLKHVRYYDPVAWEDVDGQHLLLTMRPREVYLMRLSGPCLDFGRGSPLLVVTSTVGYVASGFDRVTVGPPEGLSCRIQEIRQVDIPAVRAAEARLQSAGT